MRAKVALVRGAQMPSTSAEHGEQGAEASELIAVAERFAWRARRPLVIAVCGVPASGKSHLARAMAQLSGLPRVSSDVIRKRLAGLRATERAPDDIYRPEWNARTYAELGSRASDSLAANGGAIVDATFRHRADRVAFTTALGASRPIVFIECRAPSAVLGQRAADRERDRDRVSDAGLAVVVREQRSWDPLDEVPPSAHLTLRTDRPVGADHGRRARAARSPPGRARVRTSPRLAVLDLPDVGLIDRRGRPALVLEAGAKHRLTRDVRGDPLQRHLVRHLSASVESAARRLY